MTIDVVSGRSARIYRVDRFVVPDGAREEFIGEVHNTHALLRTLPGFLQEFVLEQAAGPDQFNVLTIVEWDSMASIEKAKAAVMAMRKEMNFDPQALLARLGIKADLATYRHVDG